MGIDYGGVRIGVARASGDGHFAFPVGVYANDEHVLETLTTLIRNEHVQTVVIGHSRNYTGEENPIMSRARAFGDVLKARTGCEVVYEDETLTSAHARRPFEHTEKTRTTKKVAVDAAAAALILQSYLDKVE